MKKFLKPGLPHALPGAEIVVTTYVTIFTIYIWSFVEKQKPRKVGSIKQSSTKIEKKGGRYGLDLEFASSLFTY